MLTAAVIKQQLAEINALLDSNHAAKAMDLADALIRTIPAEQLPTTSPDLHDLVERFFPKRRRHLIELLQTRLSPPNEMVVAGAPPGPPRSVVVDYASRLDVLRDYHIFQWTTFYRETIEYIFKDLIRHLRLAERWEELLNDVSNELARHSQEIFDHGFLYLTQRGLSSAAVEAKSIGGLQRFLYLIIDGFLQRRLETTTTREAKLLRAITSALLTGVIRGAGEFGQNRGRTFLNKDPRIWVHALGFMTGTDAHSLVLGANLSMFPPQVVSVIVPTLIAIDRLSNKHQPPDFLLTRLSRTVGETPRLEITLTSARRTQALDVSIACFYQAPLADDGAIREVLGSGVTIAVGEATQSVRGWAESSDSTGFVDASGASTSSDAHLYNLAERIVAAVEQKIAASWEGGESQLLVRNYAKDFPLEDPVLRRLFLVQRHSVKRLLEMFERGTGIHLWCSVRRSGKTTAASDLAGMTGRSLGRVNNQANQMYAHTRLSIEQKLRASLS